MSSLNDDKLYKSIIKNIRKELPGIISEALEDSRRNKKSGHINELGDTLRGQYMLGRVYGKNAGDNNNTAWDAYDEAERNGETGGNKRNLNRSVFNAGADDQRYSNRRTIHNNYELYKSMDMDKIQRRFIDYMTSDLTVLNRVVEYKKNDDMSAFNDIIYYFGQDVLKAKPNKDTIRSIEKAINAWWYYNSENFED